MKNKALHLAKWFGPFLLLVCGMFAFNERGKAQVMSCEQCGLNYEYCMDQTHDIMDACEAAASAACNTCMDDASEKFSECVDALFSLGHGTDDISKCYDDYERDIYYCFNDLFFREDECTLTINNYMNMCNESFSHCTGLNCP
jgi:hypothetical protein